MQRLLEFFVRVISEFVLEFLGKAERGIELALVSGFDVNLLGIHPVPVVAVTHRLIDLHCLVQDIVRMAVDDLRLFTRRSIENFGGVTHHFDKLPAFQSEVYAGVVLEDVWVVGMRSFEGFVNISFEYGGTYL